MKKRRKIERIVMGGRQPQWRGSRSVGAMLRQQHFCSATLSPASSLSHLPPCPSAYLFPSPICLFLPPLLSYHGGNWPAHLLVVGGNGGDCCTSGVYYCLVWFYDCLIAPHWLMVVNKRHSKEWFCTSWKVCLLCCPSCLSLGYSWIIFQDWTDYFFSFFQREPCLQNHLLIWFLN